MKWRTLIILSQSLLLLGITACRKDDKIVPLEDPCDCDSLMIIGESTGETFIYDSLGRIVYYKSDGSFIQNLVVKWKYVDDRLKIRNQQGFHGVFDSIEYAGNTGTIFHWEELTTPAQNKIVLDDNGRALIYVKHNGWPTPDSSVYHYSSLSVLDSVVEHRKKTVDKLYYNSDGLLSRTMLYDSMGTVLKLYQYFYDSQDRLTAFEYYDGYYDVINRKEYYYNDQGQLTGSNSNTTEPGLVYKQVGCGDVIHLNPMNYYYYPHYRLNWLW